MQSKAKTVQEYLASLPPERRQHMQAVRALIRKHLPSGYQEMMQFGMIGYAVPFSVLPKTYNNQPLTFAGLASQKNSMSLYLMCIYQDSKQYQWLREQFQKIGKKPDIGKSCIRFRKLEDIPLDAIGKIIASVPMATFVQQYKKIKEQ